MTDDLIDGLLYRTEGSDLDFKAEQYALSGEDNETKSELLKDILAMANAWREGPAYILLGFKEEKPNPPQLIGISEFHDDAHFQQFVNSKVTPKIQFKYEVRPYRGVTVGIITIPKQPRPFFAPRTWGRVLANTVYVRRGSSTATALPDEIAKMGAEAEEERRRPLVDISFLTAEGDDVFAVKRSARILDFGSIRDLPDFSFRSSSGGIFNSIENLNTNSNYWRDLAKWLSAHLAAIPVHVHVYNRSSFALSDCKLEITVDTEAGVAAGFRSGSSLPDYPQKERSLYPLSGRIPNFAIRDEPNLSVEGEEGKQRCIVRFPKILPGETAILDNYLAIFPQECGILAFRSRLLASELSEPLPYRHSVEVEVLRDTKTIEDLVNADAGKNPRLPL